MGSNIRFYKDALHEAAKQIDELKRQRDVLLDSLVTAKLVLESVQSQNTDFVFVAGAIERARLAIKEVVGEG